MAIGIVDKAERVGNQISRALALIGLTGLLAFALMTVLDILMRWIFNSPITGVRDTAGLFIGIITASCFALCISERNNITIRFIGNLFGPRVKELFEAFGHMGTLIIFALMTWRLWVYGNELKVTGETTWVLGWSLAPWWRGVTILVGLCLPVQAVVLIKSIYSAIAGIGTGLKLRTPEKG